MQNAECCSTDAVGLNWGPECLQSRAHTLPWASLLQCLDGVVEQLRAVDGKLAADMEKSFDQLESSKVTVTFGGRFKAGKSLMVNRLLEREILPVNIEAETGAPCFVQTAGQDRAFAVRGLQLTEFPATTEALREQLSLWRRSIGESTTDLAARVDLELTGVPIPANVQWVDTPGVDDSAKMDAASLEVFQRTDVLIWVLSSEAALSLEEQRYIGNHIESAGPQAVVFLTNVFLRNTGAYKEGWRAFVDRQLPVLCNRISESAESMGFAGETPRMLAVCGLALGEVENGEYGSGAVKALMQSIRSKDHNLVIASRLHRVRLAMTKAADAVSRALEREIRENDLAEKECQRRDQAIKVRWARFEREVDMALERLVTELRSRTRAAAQAVAAEVSASNLQRGYTYSISLDKKINEALQDATQEYATEMQAAAQRSSFTQMTNDLPGAIRSQIPAPNCMATVPETPANIGPTVGLGVAAGLVGAFFTLGIGTAAAAAATAMMIRKEKERVLAADAYGARSNIHAEAEKYNAKSSTWTSKLRQATLGSFAIVEEILERPNRQKERALSRLFEELRWLTLETEQPGTGGALPPREVVSGSGSQRYRTSSPMPGDWTAARMDGNGYPLSADGSAWAPDRSY